MLTRFKSTDWSCVLESSLGIQMSVIIKLIGQLINNKVQYSIINISLDDNKVSTAYYSITSGILNYSIPL